MSTRLTLLRGAIALALCGTASLAVAQVKVGVILSSTGPAASLGIPEKNTIALLPTEIAGKTVQYIVLDDGSDSSKAVQSARKLINEDHVDVIVGSTVVPSSLALIEIASEYKTPVISLAASASIIEPMDAKRAWMFKTPQNDDLMADAIAADMEKRGVKTVGFIGFADAYGDSWTKAFTAAASAHHLKLVANERFARADTSVTGQTLKIMSQHPDAVLVGGAGTPAALPQRTLRERGYAGRIYQTHGAANNDFLRVCGKVCDGTLLPVGPLLVADQLPDTHPVKQSALVYQTAYEKRYGAGSLSTFGGHAWDAGRMLTVSIPVAMHAGAPGSEAFRTALRGALEQIHDLPTSQGVVNTTPQNHNGLDARARVMVEVVDGKWVLR